MGPAASYSLSEEACKALSIGDIDALLAFHKAVFGGWKMEDDVDSDEDDDADSDEDDDSGDEDDDADSDEDDRKKSDKATRDAEAAARKAAAKKLQKDNAELLAKLKKYEDADKSDLDKVTGERDAGLETIKTLKAANEKLVLKNAFLQDTSYSWHNVNTAMRLLDMDGVEIDDDGEVTGLEAAIKKLATESPFLLKPSSDSEDDDEKERRQPSGQPPGRKTSKRTSELEKKYRL